MATLIQEQGLYQPLPLQPLPLQEWDPPLLQELLQQLRALLLLEWQPTLIQGPFWGPASGRGGPPLALFHPLALLFQPLPAPRLLTEGPHSDA